jgi:hypothetical protein
MLQRITSVDLDEVELVPQAILSLPISYFAKKYGEFQKREDDFDIYEGAEFATGSGVKFSLRRYSGYPKDTTTIYLPNQVSGVKEISALILKIVHELDVPHDAIQWQRFDDPKL